MQGWSKTFVLAVLGIVAAGVLGLQSANAESPIPAYASRLARGTFDHGSWSIWVFGHHGSDQCWATKTVEDGFGNENALCGFSVPARPWQFAAKGTFGAGKDQESMLFFLTRESIGSLKVQIDQGHDHKVWTQLPTHHLTAQAARGAQIERNFSYAVGSIPGPLSCIERVIATTRSGKKISRGKASSCSARREHQ